MCATHKDLINADLLVLKQEAQARQPELREIGMTNEKSKTKIVVIGGTGLIGHIVSSSMSTATRLYLRHQTGVNTLTAGLAGSGGRVGSRRCVEFTVVRGCGGYGFLSDINSQLARLRGRRR